MTEWKQVSYDEFYNVIRDGSSDSSVGYLDSNTLRRITYRNIDRDLVNGRIYEIEVPPVVLPTHENALVVHPNNPEANPYILWGSGWYEVRGSTSTVTVSDAYVIDRIRDGYVVAFEGTPSVDSED